MGVEMHCATEEREEQRDVRHAIHRHRDPRRLSLKSHRLSIDEEFRPFPSSLFSPFCLHLRPSPTVSSTIH